MEVTKQCTYDGVTVEYARGADQPVRITQGGGWIWMEREQAKAIALSILAFLEQEDTDT